jgi:hypothetical protein
VEIGTALGLRATILRWYLDDGILHSTNCGFGFPSTLLIIDHHRTVLSTEFPVQQHHIALVRIPGVDGLRDHPHA